MLLFFLMVYGSIIQACHIFFQDFVKNLIEASLVILVLGILQQTNAINGYVGSCILTNNTCKLVQFSFGTVINFDRNSLYSHVAAP